MLCTRASSCLSRSLTRTDELAPGDDAEKVGTADLDCRVKGGSGYDDLAPDFHIAGHTRERRKESSYRIGFRVVAYPRGSDGRPSSAR